MTDLTKIFDRYSLQARLAPALLVIFPVPLLLLAWFPDLREALAAIASLALTFGVVLLLAQLARDRGKLLEPSLFAEWGGKPSVSLLRWRDQRIDRHTKEQYHACLAANVTTATFPNAAQELADPGKADEAYEAATRWLLAKTRDTDAHRLLFQENISYGFRRNVLGLKPFGVSISVVSGALSTVAAAYPYAHAATAPTVIVLVSTGVVWVCAVWWIFGVCRAWVRIPAGQYAMHLLAACTALSQAGK